MTLNLGPTLESPNSRPKWNDQTPLRKHLASWNKNRWYIVIHAGVVIQLNGLKEVEDIYDVRIALEVLAAEEAATRMSKADRKKLSHILGEVTRVVKKGDKWQILKLEQDFHVIIMETSGNDF